MHSSTVKSTRREEALVSRQEFWLKHVEGLDKSGLSCPAYCRQHDLIYGSLRHWHQKLRKPEATKLIPIKVAAPVAELSLCSLELGDGRSLKILSEAGLRILLREVLG